MKSSVTGFRPPPNADEIVVVINGRILEQGTHEELMAAGGTYKKLYSLQFREYDLLEQ